VPHNRLPTKRGVVGRPLHWVDNNEGLLLLAYRSAGGLLKVCS
jgi:hypothetical protein